MIWANSETIHTSKVSGSRLITCLHTCCVAAARGLRDCARLAEGAAKWDLASSKREHLIRALQTLEMKFWLQDHGLSEILPMVLATGCSSMKDLAELSPTELEGVIPSGTLRTKLLHAIEAGKTGGSQKPSKSLTVTFMDVAIFSTILAGM